MFDTSVFTKILIAVVALLEALLIFLTFRLDIFTLEYMLMLCGILTFMLAGSVFMILTGWDGSVKRILGIIFVALLAVMFAAGSFLVWSAEDAIMKITGNDSDWVRYEVITLKDSEYKDENDLKGKTVVVVSECSKQLDEAKERLVTGFNVNYEDEGTAMDVGERLVDSSGNTHNAIIMITDEEHDLLDRKIDGFEENTKVIYKIDVERRTDDEAKKIDVTKDSFNVLISGKDNWGKLKSEEDGRSDVNMVMTVNPKTKEILLTSIPRDSYVPMHSYGANDKLTHTGMYGSTETKKTIEDFLDIDIHRDLTVNFSMLVRVINAIGGIDVESDYAFKSAISKHEYKKGMNHMRGKKALFFARERKAFKDGDMQRNKNQQKVLKATIEKITSDKTLIMKYPEILDAVSENMSTDFTDKEIKKLAKLTLKDIDDGWTVKTVSITGTTGNAPCYSMGNKELSCVFPSEESVAEAKKAIHDTMYPVDNEAETKAATTESTKDKATDTKRDEDKGE